MDEGRPSPELGNVFDGLHPEPRQVVEAAQEVESLTNHPGWAVLVATVEALQQQALSQLLRGTRPREQAEYAQRLGFLNGVNTALDAAATIVERGVEARRFLDQSARQAAVGVN